MMRTLFVACGNPLRGDDGAAVEVLQHIDPAPGCDLCEVHQLTPELAEKVAGYERVIFVDADAASARLAIEPVRGAVSRAPWSHQTRPGEVVALARALFGFSGEALVCRIPARDFSAGEGLTPETLRMVRQAAAELLSYQSVGR